MEGKTPLLRFDHVSFSYDPEDGKADAFTLKDVSFELKHGEFAVILGPNGSGKSTIAKLSNAICISTKGHVYCEGLRSDDPKNELPIRKKIGLVFQNPDNQIVASIVEEDVAFGPENLCLPPQEIRRRVDAAMKAVGIYDLRRHETHRLSGGQKQRVAIAGMIAMLPQCIVFDEPTAMLDPGGRKDVLDTIRRLKKEYGIAVVLITHFMEEAVDADTVYVMHDGRILSRGTPTEIFFDKRTLETAGLTLPDAAILAELLRNKGISLPRHILDEKTLIAELSAYASR